MEQREWYDLPRLREFGEGPWDREPDKVQWQSETGMACMIRRGPMGAWCGYVGVAPGHRWFEVGYNEIDLDVDVHGGLTYSAACDGDEESGVCHVPGPGEPETLWWLGFDCAHTFDLVPGFQDFGLELFTHDVVYRDQAYVMAETERLAAQVAVP